MTRAIAYFSNGIGNFVMMMPALQALASMTSDGKIDICLTDLWRDPRRKAVLDICDAWPMINQVISWPTNRLLANDYDLWYYSPHGETDGVCDLFLEQSRRPVPKPSWKRTLEHEADHYMDVVYAMGYQGPIPQIQFPVGEAPVLDLPHPIIAICNGWFRTERMYWAKKGWPHFEQLSGVLRDYFNAGVIGIGGQGELADCGGLFEDYTGKLPILETAGILSQVDLMITTDTGPMHIADALGVPIIALFGSTLTSKNAPRGKNSTVLISGEICSPCQEMSAFYQCQKFSCMEKITVGDVMAVARAKLKTGRRDK